VVALVVGWTASPLSAAGIVPPHNPRVNIAPVPDYLESGACAPITGGWSCPNPCVTSQITFPPYSNTALCSAYVLEAINAARKVESVKAMVLPTNWVHLSAPEQLFVLADLERVGRGLPPYLGLNKNLTAEAQKAAVTSRDPGIAPGFTAGNDPQHYVGFGSTWASAYTTLGADYFWMYSDGWGGSAAATANYGCTSASAKACWDHRDELLGYDPGYNPGVGLSCSTCEMGTGFALVGGRSSFTDLIELPAGKPPAMTFTWATNVAPYLPK